MQKSVTSPPNKHRLSIIQNEQRYYLKQFLVCIL
jgi:hypothetical protein